jgi:hypothetical protein
MASVHRPGVVERRRVAVAAPVRYPVASVVGHLVAGHSMANRNSLVEHQMEHSPVVTPLASTSSPCTPSAL